jgi:CheY-like chemotaxis protein
VHRAPRPRGRAGGFLAAPKGAGEPIWIVEDDEAIREDVADLLRGEGYDVRTAADGLEALTGLKSSPKPCLILLDLMMPRMDGWCLRAELLKQPALAAVPVVLLTGAADACGEAATLGAAGYLTKPFTFTSLLRQVQAYC